MKVDCGIGNDDEGGAGSGDGDRRNWGIYVMVFQ